MGLVINWLGRQGWDGYLCLDDVVVEKTFAKKLPWADWTYYFARRRKVYGMHIVLLLWCSCDKRWRIPVAFRVWRPKRKCAKRKYRSKVQLGKRWSRMSLLVG
jgi:hypothetical protein